MIEVKIVADSLVVFVDTPESVAKFKQLVQRATNLWPDADPEIKEFADLVTNADIVKQYSVVLRDGSRPKGLQDYRNQDTSKGVKK
jgi:hypothetical protein